MRWNYWNPTRKSWACSPPHIVLTMLLLAIKLCKSGEHACNSLSVSVSVSISISISIYRREQGKNGEHARIRIPTISLQSALED